MIANEIAHIEQQTKKRWSRDLMTWAAVAEMCAKGPVQQLRPDSPWQDETVADAWAPLWNFIQAKRDILNELRTLGLHVAEKPLPFAGVAGPGIFGRTIDKERRGEFAALEALNLSAQDAERGRGLLSGLVTLDGFEAEAEARFRDALAPYYDAERTGRTLYEQQTKEREAKTMMRALIAATEPNDGA